MVLLIISNASASVISISSLDKYLQMNSPVTSRWSSTEGIEESLHTSGMELLIDSRFDFDSLCQISSLGAIDGIKKGAGWFKQRIMGIKYRGRQAKVPIESKAGVGGDCLSPNFI